MVYNALAATAAGYALGMTDSEIAQGIKANVPIAGRNNLIEGAHYTVIDDCYNANPASMKSSLDVLAYADTRTVAVLGDMFFPGRAGICGYKDCRGSGRYVRAGSRRKEDAL